MELLEIKMDGELGNMIMMEISKIIGDVMLVELIIMEL